MRSPSAVLAALAVTAAAALGAGPAEAVSPVRFTKVNYDAPGKDTTANTSVNGEYAVIKNFASTRKCLTSWTVRDAAGHTYTFGSFCLAAGARAYLYTGKGTDTASRRYWGRGWHVWNNTGDKAYLRNSAGTVLDTCAWSSAGSGYVAC